MSEPTLDNIARSFERHLQAGNKSPKTVTTYLEAVRQLAGHLGESGRTLADARRGDVEAFLGALLERWSAATANNRYRALKVFYAWMETGWRTRERSPTTRCGA
jgi:site-specific recombinase XerD